MMHTAAFVAAAAVAVADEGLLPCEENESRRLFFNTKLLLACTHAAVASTEGFWWGVKAADLFSVSVEGFSNHPEALMRSSLWSLER